MVVCSHSVGPGRAHGPVVRGLRRLRVVGAADPVGATQQDRVDDVDDVRAKGAQVAADGWDGKTPPVAAVEEAHADRRHGACREPRIRACRGVVTFPWRWADDEHLVSAVAQLPDRGSQSRDDPVGGGQPRLGEERDARRCSTPFQQLEGPHPPFTQPIMFA